MAIRPRLLDALHSAQHVQGFTHRFYRYPAATSPELVRMVIDRFSAPGDWVMDPFVGGGTTVVEALAQGRAAVGFDVNPLAVLVSRVKTTLITSRDKAAIVNWLGDEPFAGRNLIAEHDERSDGLPWRFRRQMAAAIGTLPGLANHRQRGFAKCALLRLGQWALESRDEPPGKEALQTRLCLVVDGMLKGHDEWAAAVEESGVPRPELARRRRVLRLQPEEGTERLGELRGKVGLVITSPPYPGVHVLYHRWQVRSRRETAAPYWIAGRKDGYTPTYYTLGGRTEIGLERYFRNLTDSFARIRPLLREGALVVQVVGFIRPEEQLPRYMAAMRAAGFRSATPSHYKRDSLVRTVPNRRWYARSKDLAGSREHLLFHKAY